MLRLNKSHFGTRTLLFIDKFELVSENLAFADIFFGGHTFKHVKYLQTQSQ